MSDTTKTTIYTSNLDSLAAKVKRINKRAVRLGVPEMTLAKGEPYMQRVFVGPGQRDYQWFEFVDVTISGPEVRLGGGWIFAASLEPIEVEGEVSNLIKAIADDENLERYRNRIGICDHCQKNRQRKHTYVVLSEDGEYKQVGKTCLKDFTGHGNAESLARLAAMMVEVASDLETERLSGAPSASAYDTSEYMAWVSQVYRQDGWTPKSKATESKPSTAGVAWNRMLLTEQGRRKYNIDDLTQAEYDKAAKIIEWAKSIDGSSQYEINLKLACSCEYVEYGNSGIVASAIAGYMRAKEEIANKEKPESQWIGEVKKRQSFGRVQVTRHYPCHSDYGVTHIYTFEDSAGNQLVWFSSNEVCQTGETVELTGTVKAHNEFRGTKQTVITRCKVTGSTLGGFYLHYPVGQYDDDGNDIPASAVAREMDKKWQRVGYTRLTDWFGMSEQEQATAVDSGLVFAGNRNKEE